MSGRSSGPSNTAAWRFKLWSYGFRLRLWRDWLLGAYGRWQAQRDYEGKPWRFPYVR